MPMYCLDTSVVIALFRGDEATKLKIQQLGEQQFYINPIILAELFQGAYKASRQREALALVEEFLQRVELLSFNEHACRLFGKWHAELQRQGKQTQQSDLMIASISLAHNVMLITKNGKHFEHIAGLKILAW